MAECDRDGREVFLDAYAVGELAPVVQRALLERGLTAARALAATDPVPPGLLPRDPYAPSQDVWQVVSASFVGDLAYADVLSDLGFRPIRRFWRMLLDLSSTLPAEPPAPAGVSRRSVAGDGDRRALHALFNASFAEHFGSTHERAFDAWIAASRHSRAPIPSAGGSRPSTVRMSACASSTTRRRSSARDTCAPSAWSRTRVGAGSADGCWRARRRMPSAVGGPASRSLCDGENTTGATALYESVGFATRQVIDVWCYPLT